ncbi:MAG: TIGR03618 family F420-dependent PPOX class oxidoreductase [Chloroflexota bacterium]|nr:TIGR03618 family F420-dependent PPOX class oxidoreductase [Chloroflexota bacterium]
MTGLTPAMRTFLNERRFGVLATVGVTGAPRQTVMWFLLDGEEILFNTALGRRKPEHLAREPRVSLLVEDGYRYVCVSGSVRTITDRETTQADIRRLAARYEGDERAEQQMRSSFSEQERISYRFRITGAIGDGV